MWQKCQSAWVLLGCYLDKVRGWNKSSVERLQADPRFSVMEAQALAIVNAKEKIPYGRCRDGRVHNFWQDETHVRGIWRTTTLESYLTDEPQWETILDYDALSEKEGKNWVFKGNQRLHSDDNKCLLSLSDGGKDAAVCREFDAASRRFVEDGFVLEEAKGNACWLNSWRAEPLVFPGTGSVRIGATDGKGEEAFVVTEDLIAKGITSPRYLGIEGGSNGGLLVGVMFTQRPDLFG